MAPRLGVVVGLSALLLGGCTTYYLIKDPQTDKTFYTTSIKKKNGEPIVFTDARTGAEVRLQNSAITEVSKDQYTAAVAQP